MNRQERDYHHEWHVALNKYSVPMIGTDKNVHFMYEAKSIAEESERLPRLFAMERKGELPELHQQCSMSAPEEIPDNYLTCCLGTKCLECPHLIALDKAELPPEQIDKAKAWTCISHIVHECGKGLIDTSEGYLMTVGDRMYWDTVYSHMMMAADGE